MIRQSGFQIVTVNDVFFLQLITDLDNKHQNISIITREKCSVMHPEDIHSVHGHDGSRKVTARLMKVMETEHCGQRFQRKIARLTVPKEGSGSGQGCAVLK
jgi:hypothetical protein